MLSITLPQKPKFTSINEKTGKFEIEGCYPGYGTTLGNALRRVLLSSLAGSAITAVKIKGATHEFSTIPNVLEDVIQIILNLKQVRLKTYKDEPIKLTLKAKGEHEIKAGMIQCPSDAEVINKDAHIATITSPKGELQMEIEVGSGIGYVPVEQKEREEKEIGVISVDAIYTPVRRVNYSVENMRVGKKTDYEKITLEIVTDGTVAPEEAFSRAVRILVDQFQTLSELEQEEDKDEKREEMIAEKPSQEKSEPEEEDATKKEVSALKGLSTRTFNVLEKNNLRTIGEVVSYNETELADLEGMGAKGLKEIKKAVGEFGLNLRAQ